MSIDIDELPSNERDCINLCVLWKTEKSFAKSYNVTISAVDGTESQSKLEQNRHFSPKTSTQLLPFDRLQQQNMNSVFSLQKIFMDHLRK